MYFFFFLLFLPPDSSVPTPQLLWNHRAGTAGVVGRGAAVPEEEQPGVYLQQDWLGHGSTGERRGAERERERERDTD